MKNKLNNYIVNRPLADMHGNGVYFDQSILQANKQKIESPGSSNITTNA